MKFLNKNHCLLSLLLALLACSSGCSTTETGNSTPIAYAGQDQNASINSLVILNGTGTDVDSDNLTFTWILTTKPTGSNASLSNLTTENPTFTPDIAGTYTVNLIVFDGMVNSGVDSVTINVVPWIAKTSMPTARGFLTANTVNGKIYAIGGAYTINIPTVSLTYYGLSVVEEYNPNTDTWVTKTPMSTSRVAHASSVVNGKIYVFGGTIDDLFGDQLNTVEEYDPITDVWTTKSPMPVPRSFITSSVVNDKVYIFGGSNTRVDEYDPATDTWLSRADRPSAPYGSSSASANGKIYLIGGSDPSVTEYEQLKVEEYDPIMNIWFTKTSSTSIERSHIDTAVINGKIYAIGGIAITYYSTNEEYNPITDTWAIKEPMLTSRANVALSVVNDKIYAIGGVNENDEIISTVEEYHPN